jgi:hypothetical protein
VAFALTQLFGSQTPFVQRVPLLQGVLQDPQANGFDFVSRHSPKLEQKTVLGGQVAGEGI